MELAEKVANKKILIPMILLGNTGVGKTQIVNRWCKNTFNPTHKETIGPDFTPFDLQKNDNKVTFQLWDTPSDRFLNLILPNIFRSIEIIFIIVAADKPKNENITEIQKWFDWLNEDQIISDHVKIVVIQNKTDLNNDNLLTEQNLPTFIGRHVYLQNFSAKTQERNILNDLLCTLLPQLNFNQALLNIRPNYEATKSNINTLTELQATLLLNSLRYLLDRGPVNEEKKRYDMWFGGQLLKEIDDTKVKAPEHVCNWIHQTIDIATQTENTSKQNTLSLLYDEIILTSLNKPFSRSESTNDYYKCLAGFIEFCVNPANNYFVTRENITQLSDNQLSTLNALNTIIFNLKQGSLHNPTRPYNVTFFGGKKVIVDNNQATIKAPTHIASLLNYLIYDIKPSHIEKICFAFDFSITSKFSTCGSREQTTQKFYDNLPQLIATSVSETLQKLQVSPPPPSPFGAL